MQGFDKIPPLLRRRCDNEKNPRWPMVARFVDLLEPNQGNIPDKIKRNLTCSL